MSQTEYAAHRHVTRQAINKLVKAGKIPVDGDGRIDPAAADFALGENRARIDEPREKAPAAEGGGGLTRARTATEVYRARMAELQYDQALGKALPIEGVVEACMTCGEAVVRAVRGLAGRTEEILSAGTRGGLVEARQAVKGIERELLTRIAAAFSNMAAQATAARAPEPAAPIEEESE